MPVSVGVLRIVQPRRQCRECPTIIPPDRDLCYFHVRALKPAPLPTNGLDHVARHLREQDRPFLPLLILPLTLNEIAAEMGPGWTRRQVEHAWFSIRQSLGFTATYKSALERMAVLRIVVGVDPCVCER